MNTSFHLRKIVNTGYRAESRSWRRYRQGR